MFSYSAPGTHLFCSEKFSGLNLDTVETKTCIMSLEDDHYTSVRHSLHNAVYKLFSGLPHGRILFCYQVITFYSDHQDNLSCSMVILSALTIKPLGRVNVVCT